MLDGLDTIDWPRLSHPYEEPEKVPMILRRAADGDADAVGELWNALEHQGTIYGVTAAAVPFLLELLPRQRPELRSRLLGLLVHVAGGTSYLNAHLPVMVQTLGVRVEDYRERLRDEVRTVAAVRKAVRQGAGLYAAQLGDPDPAVRSAAAFAMARCRQPEAGAVGRLAAAAAIEPDRLVRADLLLAAGFAASDDPVGSSVERVLGLAPVLGDPATGVPPLEGLFQRELEPVAGLGAGLGLAYAAGAGMSEPAFTALLRLLGEPALFAELDGHNEAGAGHLLRPLPAYLTRLGRARALQVAVPLARQLALPAKDQWDDAGLRVVDTLLTLAFGDNRLPPGSRPADLDGSRLAVLGAIATSDKAWIYGNVNGMVRALLGLDQGDERARLRAWLAG